MRVTNHKTATANTLRNKPKNARRSSGGGVMKSHKKSSAKKSSSKKSSSSNGSFSEFITSEVMIKVYGVLIFAFALLMLASIGSYIFTQKYDIMHIASPENPPHNLARSIGAHLAHFFVENTFGFASLGFAFILLLWGLKIIIGKDSFKIKENPISIMRFSISTCFSMAWISMFTGFWVKNTPGEYLAGAFGVFVSQSLLVNTGKLITVLIVIVSLLIILALFYHLSLKKLFLTVGSGAVAAGAAVASAVKTGNQRRVENAEKRRGKERRRVVEDFVNEEITDEDFGDTYISDRNGMNSGINGEKTFHFGSENQKSEPEPEPVVDDSAAWTDFSKEPQAGEVEENEVEFEIINNKTTKDSPFQNENEESPEEEAVTPEPKMLSPVDVRDLPPYDPRADLSTYQFPPIDLLDPHTSAAITEEAQRKELTETKLRIEKTLKSFGIGITKISAIIGPTVTLYEIVPEEGVKISKIKGLEDDIALSLAALGIRIIAPIPGKGAIGIEVPNKMPSIVSMREIIASDKFKNNKYDLPIGLGKTISNEPFVCDLTKMPHLLMAGATGQGKSVGLNAVITSLLYSKHPAELKFVLVDPKKLEFNLYSTIENHFLAKLPDEAESIIIDTKKVIRTLNSLCIEMDTRYDLLKQAKVRNIKEYNAKFCRRELSPVNGHRYLPYIVLIIDEFGDLIMTAGREVEHPIARLAQLARACGIHLIIATQRPTVKIISGNIKGNFPARIAFRVVARIDSQTILDANGADQLVGKGDMLLSTGSDLLRLQCAFVDTPEVEAITNFISDQQSYGEPYALPEYADDTEEVADEGEQADTGRIDSCFMDAATLIVQTQQGSTSLIQRRMNLGYNRAGRIMDQMEKFGIVGPTNGSKAREVKVQTVEDLKVIFSKMGLI
ncbi:MAG: DNA translocase FtsK [Bacteroidales bacterium]|nr:DNA translocase FtsK [Bacteroidales bacterium]